ncbi:MAG TPA: Ig domain-containing protein, partial [Candidatus Dormibacteraeota bacterium]|nr:Ig domain-containing protein [Candidatus Dormibacteraeota bacterium]
MVSLCAFTCTSSNPTANVSPRTSPSSASHGETSPSSSTGGGTASPSSSPSSSAPASPTGAALAITSLPFHGGEVGIGYGVVNLGAGGGTPPYSWSISGGSLPAGLSLSGGGQVSGTPGAAGQPSFTVMVTDSAGGTATGPGSIKIASALAVSQPCANQCSVEEGCTICGNFGAVSGGQGPFTYTITNDNRPPGMGVSGLSLTGAFPPPAGGIGQFSLTVRVRDAYGAQQTDTANWYVFSHISFPGGSIPSCSWLGCTVRFTYSGGTPGGKVSVSVVIATYSQTCIARVNCPPPLHTVSGAAANGVVTITVTNNLKGNAAWGSNGWTGTLTVVLTDSSPCGPGYC